jgi:hypothetical protein
MLRLSEEDGKTMVVEFQAMHPAAGEAGFGRAFRSLTLFGDMVKCILLCSCHPFVRVVETIGDRKRTRDCCLSFLLLI